MNIPADLYRSLVEIIPIEIQVEIQVEILFEIPLEIPIEILDFKHLPRRHR